MGTECYKLSSISMLFQGPSWSIEAHMTLDILVFLIIMTYFVKDGQYELADYRKNHEIVNKIEPSTTRAFIKVSKRAD